MPDPGRVGSNLKYLLLRTLAHRETAHSMHILALIRSSKVKKTIWQAGFDGEQLRWKARQRSSGLDGLTV